MSFTLNSLIQFVRSNPESVPPAMGARIVTRALNSHSEWPLRGPLPNGDHAWVYRVLDGSEALFELFYTQKESAEQLAAIGMNGQDTLDLPGLLDALFAGDPPTHLRDSDPEQFTNELRQALMERRCLVLSTTVQFIIPT